MDDELLFEDYRAVKCLMDDAEPSTSLNEAREAFLQERQRNIIDVFELRQQEAWSYLADRIVGAEDFQPKSHS